MKIFTFVRVREETVYSLLISLNALQAIGTAIKNEQTSAHA